MNDVHQPSAIFVANLDTIYHVYNYISEHEIECPKDISVVCFNDFSWATLINPPTTTVKQDVDQICKDVNPTDNNGTVPASEQPVMTSVTITD